MRLAAFRKRLNYFVVCKECIKKLKNKEGVTWMKEKKKIVLVVAAFLLMFSFLFSRISISIEGVKGWALLGVSGLLFALAILLLVIWGRK